MSDRSVQSSQDSHDDEKNVDTVVADSMVGVDVNLDRAGLAANVLRAVVKLTGDHRAKSRITDRCRRGDDALCICGHYRTDVGQGARRSDRECALKIARVRQQLGGGVAFGNDVSEVGGNKHVGVVHFGHVAFQEGDDRITANRQLLAIRFAWHST